MTILAGIWVKVPPLDTGGLRRPPVYPHNWLLGLWRQTKQLGKELTTCPLSKRVVDVQIPRTYKKILSNGVIAKQVNLDLYYFLFYFIAL